MECRVCGCTDDNACPGGCFWVEPNLCSACDPTARAALGLDDRMDDDDGFGDGFAGGLGLGGENADCPANPLGVHQVIWTDASSGYCVRCRTPVHA